MMTPNDQTPETSPARHGRLFELIRQHNLAAAPLPAADTLTTHQPAPSKPSHTTLLPQEQQALGITSSFGR